MNKKNIIILIIILIFSFFTIANAQNNFGNEPIKISGYEDVEGGELSGKINKFYQTSIVLGGIAAVVVIVIGGIMYSVSGAINKKNEGKEIIISAISGLVLLLGAYVVLNTINPEIVNLSDPAGIKKIESFSGNLNLSNYSCEKNPGIRECNENEDPINEENGVLECCVKNNSCEKIKEVCPIQEKHNSENETSFPFCVDSENKITNTYPTCSYLYKDPKCKNNLTFKCGYGEEGEIVQESEISETICKDFGGGNYSVICKQEYEEIKVPNCDSCKNDWDKWDTIKIEAGGVYFSSPYYPENNPDDVKCINYAYKKDGSYEKWEYADIDGLIPCQ